MEEELKILLRVNKLLKKIEQVPFRYRFILPNDLKNKLASILPEAEKIIEKTRKTISESKLLEEAEDA